MILIGDDMVVRYRGPGTGLRLEAGNNEWHALDVGGSHAQGAPMSLCVVEARGNGKTINLGPAAVALLMEECAHYLARYHGVESMPQERT